MVMTSNQIAAMLQQQNSMFSGIASYSQQITPPMGMAPGMGMGVMSNSYMGPQAFGFNQGPAPAPPPMPVSSSWHPGMMGGMAMPFGPPHAGGAQAFGESMLGTGFAGMSSMTQGLGTLSGFAGLGAGAMGLAGLGGTTLGMGLAAAGSTPVMLGLGAAGHAASNMYSGFQQRQGVNQVLRSRFGNVMGIGQGGGGMGFSSGEMGGISTMLREMGTEDLTTNMEELTRVMDKTAGMGLYRGVQSAREFKQKFQTTVDSLKEIADIMHTTLEGATSMMTQARGMGFFTGQDISQQLASTRVMSSMTGMSMDQTTQLARQGAQFARATGGRGRQGAQAGLMSGGRIAMAQSMGILSDDMMDFATGGLTGAEGAAALSSRMQETSMRFMSRGAGRAMVAGLWDAESGGISQERLNAVMSGSMDIRELRNMGRRSISQTGGRRSEFFRDEEQLRNQVLAQGGEYLPMAIFGTHLAQKRGLGMDDPIVQRAMRRRFRMSQGEVEAATEMMQNMPQIQAGMLTKGRQVREQEAAGAGKELRGIQGLGKRLGQIWEKEVENPFRQFADDLTTDVTRGIEGIVDTMEGRIAAKMTGASRQLIRERSEFGRAVSKEARGAAAFGQADYQKFMQGAGSASYAAQQDFSRRAGAMLGMRPDYSGAGQQMYESSFEQAGDWIAGVNASIGINSSLGGVDIQSGSDVAFGLRSLAKDTGVEGLLNQARGYDPAQMSRRERAAALGFGGGTDAQMQDFLNTASGQMRRSLGYTRETQKNLGIEFRDIMNRRLQDTEVREGWKRSYMKGFGGVRNVLQHAERLGSPELRAAAQKAKSGTKAEQVAFVRMLEEEGDVVKELRVTGELSKGVTEDWGEYESDIERIRGRRAAAFEGLEEATRTGPSTFEKRLAAEVSGGIGGSLAALGGVGMAIGNLFNPAKVAKDAILGSVTSGVTGDEMERLLSDTDVSDAFVKWQTGSEDEKAAGLQRLNEIWSSSTDKGRKETIERIKSIDATKGAKGKKGRAALAAIADSIRAESYRGSLEVQNDLGRQLTKAISSASTAGMSKAGQAAWGKLQEVARLRSSKNADEVAESYEVEKRLMDDLVGTEESKEVQRALRGQEGGEYILAGLTGAEGYYERFGGGGGERGTRLSSGNVKNIMTAMLGTEGIEGGLGAGSILEAFGKGGKKGRQSDIIKALMAGRGKSQEAIEKILAGAEKGGVRGDSLERLRTRLTDVSSAFQDRKITDEEARKLASGLGGRIAGAARAQGRTEKVARADLQETANKHLQTISQAIKLMATGQKLELSNESINALAKAAGGSVQVPEKK